MRAVFDKVKNDISPDFVFWTGDSVPHNLDSLNKEDNIQIIKNVTKEMVDQLDGIKIYPAIGNHDTYPQDIVRFRKPRENEVINEFSKDWL